nr:DUF559 domain-containing protein [Bradyrhizobium sp. AC87j1]
MACWDTIAPAARTVGLPLPLAGEVIELDGGQHFSNDGERADARRSTTIEAMGFKVLRFSNLDVMTNRGGVLETIATTVAERAPTPTLPRKREREQTVSVEKKQP